MSAILLQRRLTTKETLVLKTVSQRLDEERMLECLRKIAETLGSTGLYEIMKGILFVLD